MEPSIESRLQNELIDQNVVSNKKPDQNVDNVKYMNLNFVEQSESSSQATKESKGEYSSSEDDYRLYQSRMAEPGRVVHTGIPMPPPPLIPPPLRPTGKILANEKHTYNPPTHVELRKDLGDESQIDDDMEQLSLAEMGFKANEITGWDDIVQPAKESLFRLLRYMINNHIKPNVQIRIGLVTFNCHMMVLQCYSDFFMECSNEVLIQLPEERITPAAFMMVYDWMLADEPLVQREGVLELFTAANFLKIKNLVNQCWLCLDDDQRFREDTAFLLYLEARKFGLLNLEQLMISRVCKFFLTLVSSKEFVSLTCREICNILSSNSIGVNTEVEVFLSAVRWLCYDWDVRQKNILDVAACVRFGLMPPWYLVTLNKSTDNMEVDRVVENSDVKRMINDAISYTTTQMYYGETRQEFVHFLDRYQLTVPVQRQWIYDIRCPHHHRLNCPNTQLLTYDDFMKYLESLHSGGKDYWKLIQISKSIGSNLDECCCEEMRKYQIHNLVG